MIKVRLSNILIETLSIIVPSFFQAWGNTNARLAFFLQSNFYFLFTQHRERRKTPFYSPQDLVLISEKIIKNFKSEGKFLKLEGNIEKKNTSLWGEGRSPLKFKIKTNGKM